MTDTRRKLGFSQWRERDEAWVQEYQAPALGSCGCASAGGLVISFLSSDPEQHCPSRTLCCGAGSRDEVWPAGCGWRVMGFASRLEHLVTCAGPSRAGRTVGHFRDRGSCSSLEPRVTAASPVCGGCLL